ncbi:hypothetical protein M9194_14495 [Vibrio sp. S4M6]|uniref:hypothetical protein n=1 Tax=Vibrio sinus TaxID=2946865 RepID=UPI00202A0F7C|nr:hypothetical protein [Vibrio sinus]MCL9782642.1 hypothetical protein [Vibrio sinus]
MKHLLVLIATLSLSFNIFANEYEAALQGYANGQVKTIASDPDIIAAVKAQNIANQNLTEDQIIALDKEWRAQVGQSSAPLIEEKLSSPTSKKLVGMQEASDGAITEIFVMDDKGLNVAQSAVTSDYWQGDEAKWKKTYKVGPNAYHISEVEEDESTQMFQSQVSYAITDPASGQVIGAVTVGVNVEEL